jgi:acyl carrier protein phosphodiesterase
MVGNFIADRVKGKAYRDHPPEVAQGILLHRRIDRFTDDHPLTMQSKRALHPYHGKWAGVVIDILNDHFLATEWERYSPEEDLESFAERMHGLLQEQRGLMSRKDRWILDRMVQDQWLLGYRTPEGIERAFQGLSERTGEGSFRDAMKSLEELDERLRKSFLDFFPDLMRYVKSSSADEAHEDRPPSDR